MMTPVRVALVGDYQPSVAAHRAAPRALELAAASLACQLESVWTPTPALDTEPEQRLETFDAVWCVPNSPYASMEGALLGIRIARETGRPFLGTCGGFQHAVIEYVRNVLGFNEADHAESNPGAAMPVVSRLACSLAGAKGSIRLTPGSRLQTIYGRTEIVENYNCNFGLNPLFESMLGDGKLTIVGRDDQGEVRAVELAGDAFFVATLFQPEQSAFEGREHPLIGAFVRAAMNSK